MLADIGNLCARLANIGPMLDEVSAMFPNVGRIRSNSPTHSRQSWADFAECGRSRPHLAVGRMLDGSVTFGRGMAQSRPMFPESGIISATECGQCWPEVDRAWPNSAKQMALYFKTPRSMCVISVCSHTTRICPIRVGHGKTQPKSGRNIWSTSAQT